MTRILVQRGSGSSSNQSRSSASSSSSSSTQPQSVPTRNESVPEEIKEQPIVNELPEYCVVDSGVNRTLKLSEDFSCETPEQTQTQNVDNDRTDAVKVEDYESQVDLVTGLGRLTITEPSNYWSDGCSSDYNNNKQSVGSTTTGSSHSHSHSNSQPPPPPVPPPKPSSGSSSNLRRFVSGTSGSPRIGPSRRPAGWPTGPVRTSPSESRPSSPRSHGESEGYNSADEQNPCFGSSIYDLERERQFEIDIRRAKGLEVKRMLADGNCLFRAVADQVYGDSEAYDLVRQMCIDYMERERDHFSQFITEGFTSYCKRKRRDKVHGNNVEIQALSEMYNRPIHIYSYSTEPINIFHGNYDTDTPPIRLSYHHGNHYNSLVDPRRLSVGAGLGFSSLRGRNVDKDQVKAAIKAQQDQQLDNALLAEGQFYSDLELTEKEIECMVMEASRAEYLSGNKSQQYISPRESSTSGAEPSSSGSRASGSDNDREGETIVSSSSMQLMLSMGFSYLQVIEAYSIFGDDVDSMVCYLLETASTSRRSKGKATE